MKQIATLCITPTTPFHFDATFHKPDHFTSGDNEWQPGIRWQTWRWREEALGLKFMEAGTQLAVEVYSAKPLNQGFLDSLQEEIVYRYNLNFDLSNFYSKFSRDAVLGPVIKRWRGMRPGHPSSLYEYLIIGVVLQNATVRRSIQMFTALLEHYGELVSFDGKTLWCFWEKGRLAAVDEAELRSLKVGYRAKSIKKIDEVFAREALDELVLRTRDVATQRQVLLSLYGVGPATVWYLLFDVFHHWDCFDHISPWEQKIYSKVFFNQDPELPIPVPKLLKRFSQFAPYQQLAVHYIWEDLWWRRLNEPVPWLEKLIRI